MTSSFAHIRVQDAETLWTIARQEGVIETTMALPSLRLEQRIKSISELGENDHYMVAERAGQPEPQVSRSRKPPLAGGLWAESLLAFAPLSSEPAPRVNHLPGNPACPVAG